MQKAGKKQTNNNELKSVLILEANTNKELL